jgi:hypothetical protein
LAKSSSVLKALKIMGHDELHKLSEVLHLKQVPVKKASGDDIDSLEPIEVAESKKNLPSEAKVLPFTSKSHSGEGEKPPKEGESQEEENAIYINSDLELWQRELSRQIGDSLHKVDALKGYGRLNEMYIVKDSSLESKDQMRFAATKGVLINKKTG